MELMDAEMDLEFPPLLFSKSNRPQPGMKVNYNSKLKNVRRVRDIVGSEIWKHVTNSPLGVVAKFLDLDFCWCPKLVHDQLMRHQLVCEKPYELWFLIAGQPARFSLFEFEDITGLNCELGTAVDRYGLPPIEEAHIFFDRFPLKNNHTAPSSEEIEELCESSRAVIVGWTDEEKIRLCYLAILTDCLLALDRRSQIPFDLAHMVMSLSAFESYPWGRVCFRELCTEVKSVTKKLFTRGVGKSYVLKGFVQVLQVFAYVHVPTVGQSLGLPIPGADREEGLPHLLKFKGISGLRNVEKQFADARVICMSSRSDYGIHPVWNEAGRDFKVDNLAKYINEGKAVSEIKWTVAEDVPTNRKKRRNEEEIGVRGNKRKFRGGKVQGLYFREDAVSEDELSQSAVLDPVVRVGNQIANTITESMSKVVESMNKNSSDYLSILMSMRTEQSGITACLTNLIQNISGGRCMMITNDFQDTYKKDQEDMRKRLEELMGKVGALQNRPSQGAPVSIHQDVIAQQTTRATAVNAEPTKAKEVASIVPGLHSEQGNKGDDSNHKAADVGMKGPEDPVSPPSNECVQEVMPGKATVPQTEQFKEEVKVGKGCTEVVKKERDETVQEVTQEVKTCSGDINSVKEFEKTSVASEFDHQEVGHECSVKKDSEIVITQRNGEAAEDDRTGDGNEVDKVCLESSTNEGNDGEVKDEEVNSFLKQAVNFVYKQTAASVEAAVVEKAASVSDLAAVEKAASVSDVEEIIIPACASSAAEGNISGMQSEVLESSQPLILPMQLEDSSEEGDAYSLGTDLSNTGDSEAPSSWLNATQLHRLSPVLEFPSQERKAIHKVSGGSIVSVNTTEHSRRRGRPPGKNNGTKPNSAGHQSACSVLPNPQPAARSTRLGGKSEPDRQQNAPRRNLRSAKTLCKAVAYATVDKERKRNLLDFEKKNDIVFPTGWHASPAVFLEAFLKARGWLEDIHVDQVLNLFRLRLRTKPEIFKSSRIAVMSTDFQQVWTADYHLWHKSKIVPGGTSDYVDGSRPSYAPTHKKWAIDVDELFGVLNLKQNHWIGYVVSIPDRTVTVYDCLRDRRDTNREAATFLAVLIPAALNFLDPKGNPLTTPYNIIVKDPSDGIPEMGPESGDCGVYALKFIECLMLGVEWDSTEICNKKMRDWRCKYAADVVAELRDHTDELMHDTEKLSAELSVYDALRN